MMPLLSADSWDTVTNVGECVVSNFAYLSSTNFSPSKLVTFSILSNNEKQIIVCASK